MRRRTTLLALPMIALAWACDGPEVAQDGGGPEAGMDAGVDAGVDGAADAGRDGAAADAGPDGPPAAMCDPVRGIECDGDWTERCDPACAATECCAPLWSAPGGGVFQCIARNDDGSCPVADIWVDTARIAQEGEAHYSVEWAYFEEGDCAIVEGCVEAAGWRRLLRFDTWTPNTGGADMYLGAPDGHPELFEYSPCHDHYHFNSYARYSLHDATGAVAARGHKQAFCLLDFYRYPGTDDNGAHYGCDDQGIQSGWQDVYDDGLDCQWVDVTGVPEGTYTLRIDLNYEGVINEADYSNNRGEVEVVIPEDVEVEDVTVACPPGTESGATRDCGLRLAEGEHTCTPGEMVYVGCSAACSLGACGGDPFIRVCDAGTSCTARRSLAIDDDSGCGSTDPCGRGGDCCPRATVTCPASGALDVYYAAYRPGETATCTVAIQPVP